MDISKTTEPDSTQVNAEDFLAGPQTVTVTGVRTGTAEQPVNIDLAEFPGRAYRPNKSMRRVLVSAWGKEASEYTGRKLTLYRDPEVTFGREKPGGIKISHLSHIDKPLEIALTVSRGKRKPHRIQPLIESSVTPAPDLHDQITKALAAFESIGVSDEQLAAHVGKQAAAWAMDDLNTLSALFASIRDGQATVADVFGGAA